MKKSPLQNSATSSFTSSTIPLTALQLSLMEGRQIEILIHLWDNSPKGLKELVALCTELAALNQQQTLSALARALNHTQLLFLVQATQGKNNALTETLFTSLKPEVFYKLFKMKEQEDLTPLFIPFLQCESFLHQLTVLSHALSLDLEQKDRDFLSLEALIEQLDPLQSSYEELNSIEAKAMGLKSELSLSLQLVDKTLGLAWNSTRTDLLEKFDQIKHSLLTLLYKVGSKERRDAQATGSFLHLKKRLFSVYGNMESKEGIEALLDNEPALEALAKFSLWNLSDYWKIGLLPHIQSPEELKGSHEAPLLKEVEANLTKLGLRQVKDLKEATICSLKTLSAYIQEKKEILR